MAIFHLNAKVISRGKAQSAIAAAAYRSGERLRDEQTNELKAYEARAERILFTDIMAPKDAPEWAHDRNQLWNQAERAEKRKDAQLAREFEVALPHELTGQQREWLVKDFAREAFVRKGYVVDIAIHAPDKDSDARNHHAHLMVTMRTLGPDGFAALKDRSLNSPEQLGQWREQYAQLANRHLERHGHAARVDHRTLAAQGIDREPTTHIGYAAAEMTARGGQSDRVDELRGILARNEIRLDIKTMTAELKALEKEQDDQRKRDDAARASEIERQYRAQAPASAERSYNAIALDHAAAEAEAKRAVTVAPKTAAKPAKRERSAPAATQAVAGKARLVEPGLRVFDSVTGSVTKLGDFILDFLSGSTSQPQDKQPDMKAFVTDPAARKEQQLARLAASKQAQAADKALEHIREDMQAGRNLKAEDIRSLTRQHQEQIRHFGDAAVQQMVKDAQERARGYWQGRERERD